MICMIVSKERKKGRKRGKGRTNPDEKIRDFWSESGRKIRDWDPGRVEKTKIKSGGFGFGLGVLYWCSKRRKKERN